MSVRPRDLVVERGKFAPEIPRIVRHFAAGEIGGLEVEQNDQLAELLDQWSDAAAVGEDFKLRKFLVDDEVFSPIRINACMEWHLHQYGRPLFKQSSSLAKNTWTDDRLKMAKSNGMPWWVVGRDHARDGVRHAATFIKRAREQADLRGRAWPHLFNLKGELIAEGAT